jgi:DNA-binding SARP family transcriptional activator/Flp pilus assembly protein TadD
LPQRHLHVRALGPLLVSFDGAEEAALTQPRPLALLSYLLLAEPRGPHSRDTLTALLWPDSSAEQARQAVRNALHMIRQALGEDVIVNAGREQVDVDRARVSCDVYRLESDLERGRVEAVLERFGELLDGFHVSSAPEFERWLDAARAALRARILRAALASVKTLESDGDSEAALRLLRSVHHLDRDNEQVLRRYVEMAASSGDVPGALRAYRSFAARLAREYGAQPSAETTALVDKVTRYAARLASGRPSVDGDLYVLCLRGTFLFLRAMHVGGRVEDLHHSRQLFDRVLEREPDFGPAVAGLSNYYAVCAARGVLQPFAEHFGRAIELSHRALALDPTLAIPHVHLGVQAMYIECDWERAEREFSRAVELDPSYAEARRFLGICLMHTGRRDAGLQALLDATRTESQIPAFRNSLADALLAMGMVGEAIEELRVALQLEPGYRAARDRLIRGLEREHRFMEALAERRIAGPADTAERFQRAFDADGAEGYRREREAEVRWLIGSLEARVHTPDIPGGYFSPPELRIALAHAELGEWGAARAWEERAVAAKPGVRRWFLGRPELDPLRETGMASQGVS